MKAIVQEGSGSADVLHLREIDIPAGTDGSVRVRVRATSVNALDCHSVHGGKMIEAVSKLMRQPDQPIRGVDVAGTVEAVGAGVTRFAPGDEIFGGAPAAFAEYALARESALVLKPQNLSFEQAAAVGVAGRTALQGLRDHGQVKPGQQVLISGAGGGVGTFAVQIAKALGAEVTAVCSARNVDQARSLGADHVIDYTREDFTRSGRRYDVLFDVAGSRSWRACKRVLEPEGILVMAGAPQSNRVIAPLGHIARVRLASIPSSQKYAFFVANLNREDLGVLRELIEAGKVTPVIERRYELSEVPDAVAHMGEGHARGKIVITVSGV
jgi:NADPH:quinone reductase-like Zn-dependent oxidoreductase